MKLQLSHSQQQHVLIGVFSKFRHGNRFLINSLIYFCQRCISLSKKYGAEQKVQMKQTDKKFFILQISLRHVFTISKEAKLTSNPPRTLSTNGLHQNQLSRKFRKTFNVGIIYNQSVRIIFRLPWCSAHLLYTVLQKCSSSLVR